MGSCCCKPYSNCSDCCEGCINCGGLISTLPTNLSPAPPNGVNPFTHEVNAAGFRVPKRYNTMAQLFQTMKIWNSVNKIQK